MTDDSTVLSNEATVVTADAATDAAGTSTTSLAKAAADGNTTNASKKEKKEEKKKKNEKNEKTREKNPQEQDTKDLDHIMTDDGTVLSNDTTVATTDAAAADAEAASAAAAAAQASAAKLPPKAKNCPFKKQSPNQQSPNQQSPIQRTKENLNAELELELKKLEFDYKLEKQKRFYIEDLEDGGKWFSGEEFWNRSLLACCGTSAWKFFTMHLNRIICCCCTVSSFGVDFLAAVILTLSLIFQITSTVLDGVSLGTDQYYHYYVIGAMVAMGISAGLTFVAMGCATISFMMENVVKASMATEDGLFGKEGLNDLLSAKEGMRANFLKEREKAQSMKAKTRKGAIIDIHDILNSSKTETSDQTSILLTPEKIVKLHEILNENMGKVNKSLLIGGP